MKVYIFFLLAALTCNGAMAQSNWSNYTWKISLKIIDEEGLSLSAVKVGVGFYTNSQPASIDGITDSNGLFTASQSVEPSAAGYLLGFSAEKEGYYTTRSGLKLAEYDSFKWNPTVTMMLKKNGKPIAMYARSVNENPPVLGQSISYDLMMGDWVCEGHKGVNSDIIFQKWAYRKSGTDYEYKVRVTFPKSGDGIQIYTIPDLEMGSDFRSPHDAPSDGYQPEIDKERSAHPGQPTKNDDDPNRIYLFRVRTVLDHEGRVVSAHYGKIYGDFMQFRYYLNPTPNDRNIEFDPKHNLLGGLHSFEQVTAP